MKKMWKRIVGAVLTFSLLLAVPGGAITQASEGTATTVDVTNLVTMENLGLNEMADRGQVNIYLGGYKVLPADERKTSSYCENDNASINGVDLLEYITVNGETARSIVTKNKNSVEKNEEKKYDNSYTSDMPLARGYVYSPVCVTVFDTYLEFKYLTAFKSVENLELTMKAGLSWENADGQLLKVTEDVTFKWVSGEWKRCKDVTDLITMEYRGENSNGSGSISISFGGYGMLPADGTQETGYCENGYPDTNGVDVLSYIEVNGENARSIVKKNKNEQTNYGKSTTDALLSLGGVYAPVCVTVQERALEFRYMTEYKTIQDLELTIKAGFVWKNTDGLALEVTKDVIYEASDLNGDGVVSANEWVECNGEIDVTNQIRMDNRGLNNEMDRGQVFIYLGEYKVLPLDGRKTGSYCENDNAGINGVDLLEYITVNGETARSIVTKNKNGIGKKYDSSYTSDMPLARGGIYSPVCVTVFDSYLEFKYLTAFKASEDLELTVKAGLSWRNVDGQLLKVTEDVTFKWVSGEWKRCIDVTDQVIMAHQGERFDLNRGMVHISFGNYSVVPADTTVVAGYCENDHPEVNDVDVLSYIEINGESARTLADKNWSDNQYNGSTTEDAPLKKGRRYAPVCVTVFNGYLEFKYLHEFVTLSEGLEITLKAGFRWTNLDGQVLEVTKDVSYRGMDWNEDGSIDIKTEWERAYDVSQFRANDANTTTYTHPEKDGYVFAGWYTGVEQPLTASITTGNAYAKFVDSKVLRVKAQIPRTTIDNPNSSSSSIRFLTTVDGLQYQKVGFEVTFNGVTRSFGSSRVYEKVYGITEDGEQVYDPTIFSPSSKYFKASMIQGIPKDSFGSNWSIKPYWITLDGTKVYGEEVIKSVSNGVKAAGLEKDDLFGLGFIKKTDGIPQINRSTSYLTYYSSDSGFESFLNDFYSRHIRSGEKSIGAAKMGACWSYAKEWESMSLDWFDCSKDALGDYDASELMRKYINEIDIDKFGNAYVSYNDTPYSSANGMGMPGQGWPFPDYEDVGTYGAEFTDSGDGWTVNGEEANVADGYCSKTFDGNYGKKLEFASPEISFSAELSPFVEVRMVLEDNSANASETNSDIGDYKVEWKRTDSDTWYSVKQSQFASNPSSFTKNTNCRNYFPMYLHPEWKGTIEAVKVTILPKDGIALNINAKLDYFRCSSDTRQSTSSAKYIMTLEEYVSFHNDTTILANNMNRARQALLFQLYALQGKDGLIRLDYLPGHDSAAGAGHRIANGYWDAITACNRNLEANLYFYESLQSMARMEQMLLDAGITVEGATVANPYPYGADGNKRITYDYTVKTLLNLAEKVKKNCQKNYTDGGFWNPQTGRFVWGVYDADSPNGKQAGEPLDYGMTEINSRMITSGLATEAQARSIYTWLNGERTVAGDNSTGKDIYFYQFGPRATTKDNDYDFTSLYSGGTFGTFVEDGGAILYTSYYDIMARLKLNGANDAFSRYQQVQNWYEKVQSAGGEGYNFYRKYYESLQQQTGQNSIYQLHGAGTNGAIGLDVEFYESALMYAVVPYGFFGLDATYNTLYIAPTLPEGLSYMAMTNLTFSEVKYDCLVTNRSVVLSGIEENTKGLKTIVTMDVPIGSYEVLLNGESFTGYTVTDGKIVAEIPFSNAYLQVKTY